MRYLINVIDNFIKFLKLNYVYYVIKLKNGWKKSDGKVFHWEFNDNE